VARGGASVLRSQHMSGTPSNFAGDGRYCNRDNQVMFSKTGLAGTISNDWAAKIMITANSAEIRVRRYDGVPECDVVVFFRGHSMTLRCRDYDQAVEWARIECKAYKVADGFSVERHQPNQTTRQRPIQR